MTAFSGTFRDGSPRISLALPSDTSFDDVEFIIDTGFEGELALPDNVSRRLARKFVGTAEWAVADGSRKPIQIYEIDMEWMEETRSVEILTLEGLPLLGTALLQGFAIHIEVTEGGEIHIDPL